MELLKKILIISLLIFITEAKSQDFKLEGSINQQSAIQFINNLNTTQKQIINIELNSTGGDVNSMHFIIQNIIAHKQLGKRINFTVKNICASACFTILQQGDKRAIHKDARLMQHFPVKFVQLSFYYNNSLKEKLLKEIEEALEKTHKEVLKIKEVMETLELPRLKISKEEWRKRTSTDYYLTAKEALTINAVDSIID